MVTAPLSMGKLPSVDPATGRVSAQFDRTPTDQVAPVVQKARETQAAWAQVSLEDRCARIGKLKTRILAASETLTDAVVRESGKPRVEAKFADVFVSLDTAEYFCRRGAALLRPEAVPHHSSAAKAKRGVLIHEPLGVLGVISSWNYPLAIPLGQLIPAVVAGNVVVCKASDFTPECGFLIERLFLDAGFPPGVVSVIQGGGDVGQALIEARPDKIFFTGSVSTGRLVAEACARHLIPSVLELGGKDAMIVLEDADLENASSAAVWGGYTNCGQVCLSVERLFVDRRVSDEFIRLCVEKTQKLRVGPGSDPQSDVGPLIRPHHVQRMKELIADAVERGATVLCGGRPRPELGPGFYDPTVVTGVDGSMRLFREETFGPILAIQVVTDVEDAIRLANDSEFALAASVWTCNRIRGERIARRLRAGTVMVNDVLSGFAIAEAPHGGRGWSGWGRTHGRAGLLEMVSMKYVDTDRLGGMAKPWWYRYGAEVERAADAFLRLEFGSGLVLRLKNAPGALKTIFRKHGL